MEFNLRHWTLDYGSVSVINMQLYNQKGEKDTLKEKKLDAQTAKNVKSACVPKHQLLQMATGSQLQG